MSRRKSGFTLIELLVVIAIIAILAAILFPVFAAAKKAGQKAVCQGNVKQLLQGAQMYEDDYDGGILPACIDYNHNGTSWSDFDEFWCSMVDKYIRQLRVKAVSGGKTAEVRGVYLCPSAPPVIPTSGGAADPSLARPYGYNYYYLGGNPNSGSAAEFHKTSEVQKATSTIRIFENWNFQAAFRYGCGSMVSYPPSVTNVCVPGYVWAPGWHNGSSTIGWFDGHVSSVKLCPPKTGSNDPGVFVSVMQKQLNNQSMSITVDGKTYTSDDPFWRLKFFKP